VSLAAYGRGGRPRRFFRRHMWATSIVMWTDPSAAALLVGESEDPHDGEAMRQPLTQPPTERVAILELWLEQTGHKAA
jgi:hypothetical protein